MDRAIALIDRYEYMRVYMRKRRAAIKAAIPEKAVPDKRLLSPIQKEVLEWAARGKTAVEIGMILHLAYETVRYHRDQAIRKLGAINLSQAIALGVASGVITL